MSTGARSTFDIACGGEGHGEKNLFTITKQYSRRDSPSHTKLKYREYSQESDEELQNFRKELEENKQEIAEKAVRRQLTTEFTREIAAPNAKKAKLDLVPAGNLSESDDDDIVSLMAELQRIRIELKEEKEATKEIAEPDAKRVKLDLKAPVNLDTDNLLAEDDSESDGDDDYIAALMAELERIQRLQIT